jgi:3-oxoacyl-(acyl-carrier-protein) synthase
MNNRVVISGMGVVAPNGNTLEEFEDALRNGRSGIRRIEKMEEHKFACQIAGVPQNVDEIAADRFTEEERIAMNANMTYGAIAADDAWRSAGLERPEADDDTVDWDSGAVIGTGVGGVDTVGERVVPLTNSGKVRRLGSTCVEQVMCSNVSAKVAGLFGLGNQVTTNSSACTTGTEAIYVAFERIRRGLAKRMLAGGSEGNSHYIWAGFDAMRVLARGFNETPDQASRPMSASAAGFVPGAGAGIMLLESLESALDRDAPIFAEVKGGAVNCGGHRMGGSMTAPNSTGVQRCIRTALADAELEAGQIDAISGHLTATFADPHEVANWQQALDCSPEDLPTITATKSLIGHALGAAGAIESVAAALMLRGGFIHPAVNCDDLHEDIEPYAASVPHTAKDTEDLNFIVKAGFGFGDVNSCVIFERWNAASVN